jgi:hypothetical protein
MLSRKNKKIPPSNKNSSNNVPFKKNSPNNTPSKNNSSNNMPSDDIDPLTAFAPIRNLRSSREVNNNGTMSLFHKKNIYFANNYHIL